MNRERFKDLINSETEESRMYRLDPVIGRIISQAVLFFPNGERHVFPDGKAALDMVLNENYEILSIRAFEDSIEVELQVRRRE